MGYPNVVMSNFSFSHSVFKRLISQVHQKVEWGKELTDLSKHKYEKDRGNGENAANPNFLQLIQCFIQGFKDKFKYSRHI